MEEGSGRGKRPCPATPPTPADPATEADDQEKDMEKFYALLGNIRAMRDLIRNENKRQKTESSPLWRPTFELEDFKDGEDLTATPAETSALNPSKEEENKDQKEKNEVVEEENSVDLSLSL